MAAPFSTQAALRDLPHSRHVLWRDVIKPQNGHTLCTLTSLAGVESLASNCMILSVIRAARLRTRVCHGRPPGSIDLPPRFSSRSPLQEPVEDGSALEISG